MLRVNVHRTLLPSIQDRPNCACANTQNETVLKALQVCILPFISLRAVNETKEIGMIFGDYLQRNII
jgi:hypothetical protein